jgi:hypothetical protein
VFLGFVVLRPYELNKHCLKYDSKENNTASKKGLCIT